MVQDYSSYIIRVEEKSLRGVQNLSIRYCFSDTEFGEIILGYTPNGICCLEFVDGDRISAIKSISKRFEGASIDMSGCIDEVQTFISEGIVHVVLVGTAFQLRVWRELINIPFGKTVSYGELGKRMGCPKASQAIGNAVGRNPVSILIPCHRVIRSDGSLGGYRWGSERKRMMLEYEARRMNLEDKREDNFTCQKR